MSEEFQRLSPEEKRAHYQALETDLLLVTKAVGDVLDTDGLHEVGEFIHHGEYGLAFDSLLWQVAAAGLSTTESVGSALRRLRDRLSPLDDKYEAKFQEVMRRARLSR